MSHLIGCCTYQSMPDSGISWAQLVIDRDTERGTDNLFPSFVVSFFPSFFPICWFPFPALFSSPKWEMRELRRSCGMRSAGRLRAMVQNKENNGGAKAERWEKHDPCHRQTLHKTFTTFYNKLYTSKRLFSIVITLKIWMADMQLINIQIYAFVLVTYLCVVFFLFYWQLVVSCIIIIFIIIFNIIFIIILFLWYCIQFDWIQTWF